MDLLSVKAELSQDVSEDIKKEENSTFHHTIFEPSDDPLEHDEPAAHIHTTMVKVFNCGQCNYATNDKGNFKRHMTSTSKHKDLVGTVETIDEKPTKPFPSDSNENKQVTLASLTIPCQFCEFKTNWSSHMIKHIQSEHSQVQCDASTVKKCKFCPFITSNKKELKLHTRMQHKNLLQLFTCDECNYTSNSEDSMKLHKKFHGEMKDYPGVSCDHCDFIYKYHSSDLKGLRKCKQILNEHMNIEHVELKLKCDQCDRTVWTEKQLKVHKTKHVYSTPDGIFSCDQCDYKCKKSHRLNFHINAVHLGVKPYVCEECSAAFSTRGSLNIHKMSHTEDRKFKCQFCEYGCHTKANLETHIRTHTGEKPFTCDVCGNSFADQGYFAKHKRLHDPKDSSQPVKDFVCQLCGKSFTRKAYLEFHMTSHQNGSEGKTQKYTNQFKMEAIVHAQIHGVTETAIAMCINRKTLKNWVQMSVNPHICGTCGKAFTNSASMRRHSITHQGEEGKGKTAARYYDAAFKQEVVGYAHEQSIKEAGTKYQIPLTTIYTWIKLINPQSSLVRKSSKQGNQEVEEESRTAEMFQNTQCFSEYLADHHLLPSEEQMQERNMELESRKEEKEKFALVAREILLREKEIKVKELLGQFDLPVVKEEEDTEDFDMSVLAPITCLTVGNSDEMESSQYSGSVKTEPEPQLEV